MKLVTIDQPPRGRPGAVIGGDEVLDFARAGDLDPLAGWIPGSVAAILAGGEEGLDIVRRVVAKAENAAGGARDRLRETGALAPLSRTRLMAPLPRPGIVLSHGRAYMSHLREMQKTDTPKVPEEPTAFLKNTNAIIGPDQPIVLPPHMADKVDHEGEFSVVFGRRCVNVSEDEAMGCIAGYTIVNDVSARDWAGTGNMEKNRMGKQLAGFCPLGPWVVTRDEIADPQKLNMTSKLNGEIFQSACTDDCIWTIPQLVAHFSQWYPFGPGDVMTTGSPPGVGHGRTPRVYMKPGDVIEITVEGVGTLRNPIAAG